MKKLFKLLVCLFALSLTTACVQFLPYDESTDSQEETADSSTTNEETSNGNTENSSDNTNNTSQESTSTTTFTPVDVTIHVDEDVDITPTGTQSLYVTASDVVDAVGDTVVEILTETYTTSKRYGTTIESAAGSGVIIDDAGFIITNNHVIEDADTIAVTLRNGDSYSATLIATDEENDIAVISITPDATKPLTYAVFGDSDDLRVAEDILVIGNPLGSLGGSVTKGIISALDRQIQIDDYVMNLLQIDAAVNPGNSGGALFDMNGKLVGIVNAKSTGEEIDGIGFAIPSNDAQKVFSDLCQYGYVKGRTALPIEVAYTVYSSSKGSWGYRTSYTGVFVTKDNDTYGVKATDYIYQIDDVEVETMSEIYSVIRQKNIGDTVTIKYYRDFSTANDYSVEIPLVEYSPNI